MSPEDAPSTASTEEDTSASSTAGSGSAEESTAESGQDATTQEGVLSCIFLYTIMFHPPKLSNMDHN